MWPVQMKDGKGIILDYRQVIAIERQEKVIVFHTRTEEFGRITSIRVMADALHPLGFSRLDEAHVVNMSSIKMYDPSQRIVFFDTEITPYSKRVYVSRDNVPLVRQYVREHPEVQIYYHRNP